MKDRFGGLSWPFVPLVLVALLAPILGGQVSTDSGAIHPGFGFLLAAVGSGPEAPTLTHALLGLVLAIAALGALLGRRVIQMPSTKLLAPALILFGLIPLSVASSSFKGVSAAAAAEWSLYLVAMLTVVALAGRRVGPTALCGTIFAACIWIARRGILEYIDTKDPTWRIFAGWTPNSLAGMLLIGLFVGLGLALVVRRPWSLLFLVGLVPIFYALLLTQSKGAVIAGIAGLGVLGALFAVSRARAPALPWVGRLVIAGLLMITMGTLFAGGAAPPSQPMAASSQPGAANVLNRFTQAGATQDQSAGFRRLLWQSSARLIVANPSGWGIGTFRGESARPGLTTQTQLAHSNLWQLGVEASPFAPVSLLALLAVWLEVCLRSGAALQPAQNRLRFAIVAAVAATFFHGVVESNLYSFGIGLSLFLLLGVGLQLSADGAAPEFTPRSARWTAAGVVILATGALMLAGWAEGLRATFRGAIASGNVEAAQSAAESLQAIYGFDGETWYLASQTAIMRGAATEALEDLNRAADLAPMPRTLRALASADAASGNQLGAQMALKRALEHDPNNLPALLMLVRLYVKMEDFESAEATARRLIEVEAQPYFAIRSIPEIIPTETYDARVFLASRTPIDYEKASLLAQAVDGYGRYRSTTLPTLLRFAKIDPNENWGGESLRAAIPKLRAGLQAAQGLATTYRKLGRAADASTADAAAADFAAALVEASSLK